MSQAAPAEEFSPNQHTYVRLILQQLWENLPLILLAGGVFSLLCAPAVLLFLVGLFGPAIIIGALTVGPAWAALLALEADIGRGVGTHIGVMLRALPRYWRRSAGIGLLAAFPLLAGLITLPNLSRPQVPAIVWGGLAADGLGLLIVITLSLYAVPQFVLYDADLRSALRNALLLSSRHIVNTTGLLGLAVLLSGLGLYVSSSLFFLLPAVWGLFVVNNCRMVVEEEVGGRQQ